MTTRQKNNLIKLLNRKYDIKILDDSSITVYYNNDFIFPQQCDIEIYKNNDSSNYCYLTFDHLDTYLFKRISNKKIIELLQEFKNSHLGFASNHYKNLF